MLVVALLLGTVVGLADPSDGDHLALFGKGYIAIMSMAATPLIVVAVFFGLRRLMVLPRVGLRLGVLFAAGLVAMVLCALVAAVVAQLWGAGAHLDEASRAALGGLSLQSEDTASVRLFGSEGADEARSVWASLVPHNFYHALAFGSLPAVLFGALCFGFALAVQDHASATAFHGFMEGTYRGLETLIERLNVFLPVMAFALAATIVSASELHWIRLMGGFLGPFMAVCLFVIGVCAVAAAHHLGIRPLHLIRGLRRPFVIGLLSGGTAAAVPGFIDAMCNQLGFRRDLVEFAAPVVPVFLRVGDAVFFAVLAVFVMNVYGRPPGAVDLAVIALAATLAALTSTALPAGRSLPAAVLLLGWLDLPAEAVLPVFVLLELLCEGPRNVLALALACALVALVSRGLPSEARQPNQGAAQAALNDPVRIVAGPGRVAVVGLLLVLALGTACLAGIGVGLRQGLAAAPVTTPGGR